METVVAALDWSIDGKPVDAKRVLWKRAVDLLQGRFVFHPFSVFIILFGFLVIILSVSRNGVVVILVIIQFFGVLKSSPWNCLDFDWFC